MRTLHAVGLVFLAAPLAGCLAQSSVTPEGLTCEMRANPLGIGTVKPRLGFVPAAAGPAERGAGLSRFRLIAAASAEDLAAEKNLLWDVVRGEGPATQQIEYAGRGLSAGSRVWWKVRCTDQAGRDSAWSEPASFSVGLVDESAWRGSEWIGLDAGPEAPLTAEVREELRRQPWIRKPGGPERSERAVNFMKRFELKGKAESAYFAGCVDQFGQVRLNGTVIADIHRWDLLKAFNAEPFLRMGANSVTIEVRNEDGFNPAASGMFVVKYGDGTVEKIPLDASWRYQDIATAAHKDVSPAPLPVEVSKSQPWGGNRNTEHFMAPAPYLRTLFTPEAGKTVARATLYATALGVYEAHLNGRKVGSDELAPGWTEYTKRVYHQTYDVTGMLVEGENCLGAVVGDGWYAGLMGYTGRRHYYGGPARLRARLEIAYTDGSVQVVATGPSWRGSFGPILHTDNYMGSGYDARREMPGWDTAGFEAARWAEVTVGDGRAAPAPRQVDVTEKIREAAKFGGKALKVGPDTLGEPCYGVVKTLRVEYTAGGAAKAISFREGEMVNFPRPGESGEVVIVKAVFGEAAAGPPPVFVIEPQPGEPVRRHEELAAREVTEPRPGRYVFDLGQNMVGWTRIKVKGKAGQRLALRHAEMLNPDGTPYTSNLRGATGVDFLTLRDGEQVLEPPFTFHGFRYVEVWGLAEKPGPEMVTGIVAHTAMRPTGTFRSSSPLVDQLVHNIVWGQKGNYLEVPTDCPQRDERLGWTGDAQFFVKAASYNFDIGAFMSRWLKTLNQDAQFEDGTFAHVAPKVNERGGSTAWGDAAIVCTHAMYWAYGDARVISDNYDAMRRYIGWLDGKTKEGIAHVGGFGDWLNLSDPTSPDLIDTAQRILLLGDMAEMARVIGRTVDAEKFEASRRESIEAFRARFVGGDGSLKESGQTGYAMAFTIPGILAEPEKTAPFFRRAIEAKKDHLATGFIGTPRLLPGLFNAGLPEVASKLLLTEDYPSWLYQVKLGATTMWERWDGWTPERGFQDVGMNSFNHYAFGAVGDALYSRFAGISALAPGYRRILIAPFPRPGAGLTWVDATYDSPAGRIRSAWKVGEGRTTYEVTIPPNTTAEVRLPAGASDAVLEGGRPAEGAAGLRRTGAGVFEAAPGSYRFEVVKGTP